MIRKLIPKPVRRQLSKLPFVKSPVWWANFGPASRFLATHIPPQSPPVVILSMPRSGSSWVGEIMGLSPGSLYLREPITQTYLNQSPQGSPSFFEFDGAAPPKAYQTSAKNVFSGLPRFNHWITIFPKQWALSQRRHKRIITKEVNPFMLPWLIKNYRPRIIYLLRHPVATASSFKRMGWAGEQFEFRLSAETLKQKIPHYPQFTHSFWAEHGAFQAFLLQETLKHAEGYDDFKLVKYKDICANPLTVFKDLYGFSGLEWNETVERKIRRHLHPEQINTDPYSIYRDTAHEVKKWKKQVPEEKIVDVKNAWLSFDLPYYRNDW